MRNAYRKHDLRALGRGVLAVVLGFFVLSGCDERDSGDGDVINEIILPTDVVLNLYCENVGIGEEKCVLDDPENPYALVPTGEFDPNDPESPRKFALLEDIPAGPTGAKARFYLWATALARFPSGENQYYTALALHELFDANSNPISKDEIAREQALKAYRSVLDNFFGSATFFGAIPVGLNEETAKNLFFEEQTGFELLVPSTVDMIEVFFGWGYRYDVDNDLVLVVNF